jgi:hypothetical protein
LDFGHFWTIFEGIIFSPEMSENQSTKADVNFEEGKCVVFLRY